MPESIGYPGTVSGGESKHGTLSFDSDAENARDEKARVSADTMPVAFGSRDSEASEGPSHSSGEANFKRGGTDVHSR